MKVLFVTFWYPSEEKPAKGLFVREHARAVSLLHDVTVLHLAGPRGTGVERGLHRVTDRGLTAGLPTYRVRYPPSQLPGSEYARFLASGIAAVRKLVRMAGPFDVIHANEFDAAIVARASRLRRDPPIVLTEHSGAFTRRTLPRRSIWRAKTAFRLSRFVLPVSLALEGAILEISPSASTRVVPNTVDLGIFHPIDGSRSERRRLSVVSRLNEIKGLPVLLEACELLAQMRDDWQLDIVGDGPGRQEYQAMVQSLGLSDVIAFHGLQSRKGVATLLQHADLHVVPSLRETFCVAAVEALACGVPVVATRSGGPQEFINSSVGILVEPGDPRALAEAIDLGLESEFGSSKELSAYARDRFGHGAVARQLSEIYSLLR